MYKIAPRGKKHLQFGLHNWWQGVIVGLEDKGNLHLLLERNLILRKGQTGAPESVKIITDL
jgi:hypothetical protein